MALPALTDDGVLDADSRAWLDALAPEADARDEAIGRLHQLLLRGAHFEIARRRGALSHVGAGELEDIALQSANDALVAVLAKLDQFRGHSRFTTWAYKFVLLETAVKLRRRPWHGRELPLEPDAWPHLAQDAASPHADAERNELLEAVRDAIETELTSHQREILLAVALNGVPIDVLAERLGTTRGALYKTIHDARRKLRRKLHADGYAVEPPAPRERER
jgi:RNA polymerase sigma-70 factor (ECF subfamily)